MAASIQEKKRITEADLLALGDEINAEVIDGELVIMPFANLDHGTYGARLSTLLNVFVAIRRLGRVLVDQTTFITEEEENGGIKNSRIPDVSYMSFDRIPLDAALDNMPRTAPNLAVEIISPSENPSSILSKTKRYFDFGVGQVWLVFHRDQTIHVCTPDNPLGEAYGMDDQLSGGTMLPGFSIPVRVIFDEADAEMFQRTIQSLITTT